MSEVPELTREEVLAWLRGQLHSETLREGLVAMTTPELRRYKDELQSQLMEMKLRGRLRILWQVPMA